MDPRHQSARISRKGVAEVDKVKELEAANRSDSVENSDQVAVDEVVPETDDEAMEDAVVIQAVIGETDPGNESLESGPVEGAKEEQVHASQNNSLNDQVCKLFDHHHHHHKNKLKKGTTFLSQLSNFIWNSYFNGLAHR